ncbi:MAG: aminotransferase class V-fold PLP-dependent enzyme [Candidatus Eisenbacteria bacterium]|uniref:Aminotransferase class V-fold PLP-dependent enzyme n=1 Tax=Eiseniibacteriota bacterium TaxID=2212470 RepID=A0A849SE57_UNCEI|nr:aminotransferase class V-fold PLP-dependent enzyme [Candidatus Eisenbacteria bacterium]
MKPALDTSTDPLLTHREQFPTLEHTLHFISHSLGAMPRGVEESLAGYARTWRERSIRAWEEEWFELPTRIGDLLAGILNAPVGSVSMHGNVSEAQALFLSALDFAPPRNRLVCGAEDFPSMLYLYEGLARRGVEVVRVSAREGRHVQVEDLVEAIDERTAVVAISHVMFRTAQVLDLAPITARAHAAGALTLIDAYQSVGTVPVDVSALGVDALTGGSVKWLCGGPGAGYLYVAPRVAAGLSPAVTGWMAHENPFDFDSGPMRRHAGARRFWTGTPSIPSYLAARPGYELVASAGVTTIRAKSLRQTARMIAWADEFGMRVSSPRDAAARGGTVVLDVPGAARACAALLARDVLLDFRPGVGLRLAPHFYTRDAEVDQVMRQVRDEVRGAG